jgi:hypothetical protein
MGEFFGFFFFYVCYSTLLHLPTLRFHCVGGCWDRNKNCCYFGIDSQTLLGYISSVIAALQKKDDEDHGEEAAFIILARCYKK